MPHLTILAAARYPHLRDLCLAVKDGSATDIRRGARLLAETLPHGPLTLVPIPSHTGRAAGTRRLCHATARWRHDRTTVLDCLAAAPHASRHAAKHDGAASASLPAPSFTFISGRYRRALLHLAEETTVVLVDDVADSGATLLAATELTQAATAAALAATGRHDTDTITLIINESSFDNLLL